MTFLLQTPRRREYIPPAPRASAGMGEVTRAAYVEEEIEADVGAYGRKVEEGILREIGGRLGPQLPDEIRRVVQHDKVYGALSFGETRARMLGAAAAARALDPASWGDLPTTEEELRAESARRRSAELKDAKDTLASGPGGFGQMLAEFVGGSATVFADPRQAPLMLLGAGGGGFARVALGEAAAGALGEAVILPAVDETRDELELPPLTTEEAALRIGTGAAFGGGLAAVGFGAARAAQYLAGRGEQVERTVPEGADPGLHGAAIEGAAEALADGRLPAAPAPVETDAEMDGFVARVIRVESSGRADARNPGSSAAGAGQFIKGTWLEMIRRHRPDLAAGRTEAELLALRDDPVLSAEMTAAYAAENRAHLQANGLPATQPNLYLAHFLGPGGAVRALTASPDAPISAAMTPDQLAANEGVTFAGRPIIQWTVRDLRRWSEHKMGLAADPGDAYQAATRRGYTRPDQVVTPDGRRVSVTYEVVDLDDLTLAAGDRQPRDRSRAAPTAQVRARAAALDPAQLLPSPLAGTGAPVVGPDGIIDSGNGRVMSIRVAAEQHPDRYAAYLEAIRGAGFDVPEALRNPVLIARRTDDLDAEDLRAFVRSANDDVVERLSPGEQARTDGAQLSDRTLGFYDPEAGGVAAAGNRAFVAAAVQDMPAGQRGAFAGKDGRLTAAGAARLENALLARAFDAPDLVEAAAEGGGAEVRGLLGAMKDVAPDWATLRRDVADGAVSADYDISAKVADAVRLIRRARQTAAREGIPVRAALEDALRSVDMLEGAVDPVTARIVGLAYRGGQARGRDAVADALRAYVREARLVGEGGPGLFGEAHGATPLDILDAQAARMSAAPEPAAPPVAAPDAAQAELDAGPPIIDVAAVNPTRFSEGATSPEAVDAAAQTEASLLQDVAAAKAAPDAELEALRGGADFAVEFDGSGAPTRTASDALDDLAADRDFAEAVEICSWGGRRPDA